MIIRAIHAVQRGRALLPRSPLSAILSDRRMKRMRQWLTGTTLIILLVVAVLLARDVVGFMEQPSALEWFIFYTLTIIFGVASGWYCRPPIVLITLTLSLSYIIPYAFYYVPDIFSSPVLQHESRKWAPLLIPKLMLYGSRNFSGSTVTRSFAPLPSRTVI